MRKLTYIRKGNKVLSFDLQDELTSYLNKFGFNKYNLSQKMIKKIIHKKYDLFNDFIDFLYHQQLSNYHIYNYYMNKDQLEIPYTVMRKRYGTTNTLIDKHHIYNYELIRDFYKHLGVVYFVKFSKQKDKSLVNYQFNPIYLTEFEDVDDIFSTVKYQRYITNDKPITISTVSNYMNETFGITQKKKFKMCFKNSNLKELYQKLSSIIENDISLNSEAALSEIIEKHVNRTPIKSEKVWYNFHDDKSKLYFKYNKQFLIGFKLDYYLSEVYNFGKNQWVSCIADGRFYSSITNMPSMIRKHLMIDNEPVVEIDAANSQPGLMVKLVETFIRENQLILNQLEKSEIKKYRKLTGSGNLYNYLKDCYIDHYKTKKKSELPKNDLSKDISLFKSEVISSIFFSRDYEKKNPKKLIVNNTLKNIFRNEFPFIANIINIYKKVNHNSLAIELQQIEVDLIIHQCSKKLLENNIKVITIHDGLLVKQSDYDKALGIVKSIYSKNNLTATFKNKMNDDDISTGSAAIKIAA